MPAVDRLCVFCGSSAGVDPDFAAAAAELGDAIARRGIELVYGGGEVGLMGVLADAVLAGGGRVTGVIPTGLFTREIAHRGVTELYEVASMHERKTLMYDLSDAFVALPGGLGTLEELAEVTTWAQLGLHAKPVALLDVAGFWAPLVALLDRMVAQGFVTPRNRALITSYNGVDALLEGLVGLVASGPAGPPPERWITRDER